MLIHLVRGLVMYPALPLLALAIAQATSGTASAGAAAKGTVDGLPTERWIVDWGAQRCSLVRRTADSNPLTMVLRTSLGAHAPELVLSGDWRGTDLPDVEVKSEVLLAPGKVKASGLASTLKADTGERLLFVRGLDLRFFDQFADSTELVVRRKEQILARIQYRAAAAAIKNLRECNDNLLASWGVDTKHLSSLQRQPVPIAPHSWVSAHDYPDAARRNGRGGSVVVRFTVGTNGRISECVPVVSSGTAELDAATCRALTMGAKYEPALDSSSRPVAVRNVQTMHWLVH